MNIPGELWSSVLSTKVDHHKVCCNYAHWRAKLIGEVADRLATVECHLGASFGRDDVAKFYRTDLAIGTKFLAAMMWGYEAPADSKRAGYGPWRVNEMFGGEDNMDRFLVRLSVGSYNQIAQAYEALMGKLPWCGPNFFTKHLYFLGRSSDANPMPLIFDNRVAEGIAALLRSVSPAMGALRVSPSTTVEAYLSYLRYVHHQAELTGASPEQIELYLFQLGRSAAVRTKAEVAL